MIFIGQDPATSKATVAAVFSGFALPDDIGNKLYDGSPGQLRKVTRAVGLQAGQEAIYEVKQPSSSAFAAKSKSMAAGWWDFLVGLLGLDAIGTSSRNSITKEFRTAFDQATFKGLTGQELPQAKNGFSKNALQSIRLATDHGDAAIILYRVRYWWPKASVTHQGKTWIAKTHKQWAAELGMRSRTFRTAYSRLLELSLIESMTAEFKGYPMMHIRPTHKAIALFQNDDELIET